MKISSSNSVRTHDTSNGRANDIVDELSNVSRELSDLNIVTKEIANKSKDSSSPYLTDRPSYNPTQIKGTNVETQWKNVNISKESDLRDVDAETVEQKQKYVQHLKSKLNII